MRILIAEDDVTSRIVLERTLAKWGHEVIVTTNGNNAWESIQRERLDFAILDWMMPGTDGVELCRRIRQMESAGSGYIYVILLTAKSLREDIVNGLEAGADDYVKKPFDHAELRSRIKVGERVVELERALASKIASLEKALADVKQLSGLIPICMHCKRIRDDKDYWHSVESYITEHSEAMFSHGLCPECLDKYYPESE
ncbi:MAG: response regulator [Candidatus Coatesbacteria bacterium]|nr:response regulator [Candidatus Coatesbacteria bacterium]